MQQHHGEVRREDFAWLIASLCALYRIPFDAALLAQDYPPPYRLSTLHEAARALGIKTGDCDLSRIDWQNVPFPLIAFEQITPEQGFPAELAASVDPTAIEDAVLVAETPPATEPVPPPLIALLIVKATADTLLYFRPGHQTPETMPIGAAADRLAPDLILVAREATTGSSKDQEIAGFASEKKAFGFAWFIPELKKHKKLWREFLLASLAIQLVGLTTPLFTQVIIDKVVVHQSNSTLIALGIALVMFMLFTSGMSWLRQYLVLHTGNRIDAVLGSQVLRHLLRLPLPYFEQRTTGVLVARLHGVETIREFVSGAAVTLILDFPFLIIFLAVMFAYQWQSSADGISWAAIAGATTSKNGTLPGIGLTSAQEIVGSPNFGSQAQALQPPSGLRT